MITELNKRTRTRRRNPMPPRRPGSERHAVAMRLSGGDPRSDLPSSLLADVTSYCTAHLVWGGGNLSTFRAKVDLLGVSPAGWPGNAILLHSFGSETIVRMFGAEEIPGASP